jgi:TetR/AcrR family transcriptional regulator, transcriptional repressor for nem operon
MGTDRDIIIPSGMFMRTASDTSETKDRLLKVATELMIEKGFVATTVDDICEAAKVTKGAFFHYFGTKEDLAEEAIAHFSEKMRENFKACCPEDLKDPLDRIYATVDAAIAHSQRPEMKGCLVGTLSQEISASHERLRLCCADNFNNGVREILEKFLTEAKKKYAPKGSWNPGEIADQFIATAQGAMVIAKARENKTVIKTALTHYKCYLKSLFGR